MAIMAKEAEYELEMGDSLTAIQELRGGKESQT
jgi:hypothetical protein